MTPKLSTGPADINKALEAASAMLAALEAFDDIHTWSHPDDLFARRSYDAVAIYAKNVIAAAKAAGIKVPS